ncbi:MAG: exodeoxyribonuclease VII large subunit [Victivallaceae bacterium]|nr:exodeoxyribonuclease VII large subunit [Victivallaceae bacterium]
MDEPVWSVSQVNDAVRDMIENSFSPFWMSGEIGSFSAHQSGHVYLTLKDESSQIRATWFGGLRQAKELGLKTGDRVEVNGRLTVYPVRGEYQFNIRTLRPAGRGNLLIEFERIKRKLDGEGLFAPERKRRLPAYPRSVGVVTARDGAAVRDFIRLALENFSGAAVTVYPAAVQGARAVSEVCAGIDFFNASGRVDVIVVTRGGGSIEDLWPFNDETLARKVAGSRLPVVSAVGHEIDFTICDFAADLRCATPSAAAVALFGGYSELALRLAGLNRDLPRVLRNNLEPLKRRLARAAGHYVFHEPRHLLELYEQRLDEIERRGAVLLKNTHELQSRRLAAAERQLAALGPDNVLSRGYAMVRRDDGTLVTGVFPELAGGRVVIDFANGSAAGEIDKIIAK